ncbi:LysR family transcriptional regulator [Shewanella surugensis]|uniref:LysR family transcriptional regulator n=1 Tax=Shewanella surugensis TaxID=212020 RepID=A0ABT0L6C7_9GAMM|nr:LysR family transcriptional regulator [Shewanella surugensis]MCL1123247.1 LysR family transcriptional regulator [Shewanella surugensis]
MLINELRAMAIFAEVVKKGSFRGAARTLNLSPSVVSYHITQLEKRIGTTLTYRSTRKISLTHDGEDLYLHVQQMLQSAQTGLDGVTHTNDDPSGKLTLSLPSALTYSLLNERIAQFSLQYPKIRLSISYNDIQQDLIQDSIDMVIRAGNLQDSSLKSKRIGSIQRKLVCSPHYLKSKSIPTHPEELSTWQWIKLNMLPNSRQVKFNKINYLIKFKNNIDVDNVAAMTQFTLLGLGVSTPPSDLIESALLEGNLVELLPQWKVDPIPLYALWPNNVSQHSLSKRLLSFLSDSA